LSAAAERARTLGYTTVNHVVQGSVVEAILEYCREMDATIIVIGTHGRKGVERALLGTTCEGILHRAEMPVFAVHQRVGAYGGGIDGRDPGFRAFGGAETPAL
jgi:nucleotide-binding universal stress UspA family protein